MKVLREGDVNVKKMIRVREVDVEKSYQRILYSCLGEVRGKYFLKQIMSGEIYELTEAEWKALTNLNTGRISGREVIEAGMEWLVLEGVLIPIGNSALGLYTMVRMAIKNVIRKERGCGSYILLPTLACNARCPYCFEEGMQQSTMSPETVDRVTDYILKTKKEGKIQLKWFGGEPLVVKDIISKICRTLTQAGVSFDSTLVTNGVLITKEMMKEAKEEWHLKRVQVSVDGRKEDYEARKCYCNPKLHNYETMLSAVRIFLESGVKVQIRCNYDAGNLSGLRDFIDDLYRTFGDVPNLTLYFAMLNQAHEKDDCVKQYEKVFDLYRYMDEKGIPYRKNTVEKYHFNVNYCMANTDGDNVVIGPKGDLYHCEGLMEEDRVGNIRDDIFSIGAMPNAEKIDERCKDCPFLPECTPFYKSCCPDCFEQCREFKELDTKYAFEVYDKESS